MAKSVTTAIFWFRNDLRLHDNVPLVASLTDQTSTHLLPIYIFDPRYIDLTRIIPSFTSPKTRHYSIPRTSYHRLKFLIESIDDLKSSLLKHNSSLIIRYGRPEDVIPALVRGLQGDGVKVSGVYCMKEVCSEERDIERRVAERVSVPLVSRHGGSMVAMEDLPFGVQDLSDVYTVFRKRVESLPQMVRPCIPLPHFKPLPPASPHLTSSPHPSKNLTSTLLPVIHPTPPPVPPHTSHPFVGGETSALSRLNNYLFETHAVSTYKQTRNGLMGDAYSTKFSSFLAHGNISPRKIYEELKRYEAVYGECEGAYWVVFELLWRDYFRLISLKYTTVLFHPYSLRGTPPPNATTWSKSATSPHAVAFMEGRTGVPFVDAGVREMLQTGYTSNRTRQNLASFLTKDLFIDWRLGAEFFESWLVDYDCSSNYGNWSYAAGIGNDPREERKFNVIKQAWDYDKNGDYVRMWLPELEGVDKAVVHTPWKSVLPASVYPRPIVMAKEWDRHSGRGLEKRGGDERKKENKPRIKK
ncbi:hypothetical protein SmJEL517_g04615 [Synchytrium microbalum]|uniref:Cryptochrome DASH n=1 Tax=Synchytrium microbalum TaxID=1806994 RepID=A0A507BYI9_9FUNG|nr:uncharacterized protein SmJEL517_g04615 [Synchytrium microbalum]TPX32188.1 hypothetical protein SmJEL517_g04615 [Synchytrium microbalum]